MWRVAGLAAASMGFIGAGVLALSLTGRLRVAGVLSIVVGALCLMALAFAS